MASKNSGAESATGTTTKASKTAAAPKVKTYKRLGDALTAFDAGEMPRGTKLIVGPAKTSIVHTTKNTLTVFFVFDGSPSDFVTLLLRQVVKSKLKVDITDGSATAKNTPSDDGE